MSNRSKRNLSESPESAPKLNPPNPRKILNSEFITRRSEVRAEAKSSEMDANAKLDWIMTTLKSLNENVNKTLTGLDKLEAAVEDIRRQQVSKSLVIFGLTEPDGETYAMLENETENLMKAIGVHNFDPDNVKRMGRPQAGKTRPVIVEMLRTRDKHAILKAKSTARQLLTQKKIYIYPEKTKTERTIEKDLAAHAKNFKSTNPGVQTSIRNSKLRVDEGGQIEYYQLDATGNLKKMQRRF